MILKCVPHEASWRESRRTIFLPVGNRHFHFEFKIHNVSPEVNLFVDFSRNDAHVMEVHLTPTPYAAYPSTRSGHCCAPGSRHSGLSPEEALFRSQRKTSGSLPGICPAGRSETCSSDLSPLRD